MYPAVIRKSICPQNNKTESLQNSTSVKQQNSVSTQQRNSKTVTSVSQYFSQSVLTSISQSAFLNKTPPDLPFFVDFVPDVGFGNGWFASSDWPANKRERDVIFDPFLSPRNIICSGLSKLCFPLREIDFVTENSLPARGWKTPPKSSLFTGATVARPEIWPAKDFRDPFARKQGRSGHFGVEKWRFIAQIRLQNNSFSTDFRRLRMQNFGQISRIWTCF